VPVILDVSFGGNGEGVLIVLYFVLQRLKSFFECVNRLLVSFLSGFNSSCKGLNNVDKEHDTAIM
jgi:hypothetical protein